MWNTGLSIILKRQTRIRSWYPDDAITTLLRKAYSYIFLQSFFYKTRKNELQTHYQLSYLTPRELLIILFVLVTFLTYYNERP